MTLKGVKAIDPHQQLQDALAGEAVWLLQEHPSMTFIETLKPNKFIDIPWYLVRDDVLTDARQRRAALQHRSPKSLDEWKAFVKRDRPAWYRGIEMLGYAGLCYTDSLAELEASMSASVRMMRVALQIRRYWQANHHLPIDLSDVTELPTEITIDPYTGSEFAIRNKNEHTIVLLSAGGDGVIAEDLNDADDIVIELKMPK